jgi:hypothetical protein
LPGDSITTVTEGGSPGAECLAEKGARMSESEEKFNKRKDRNMGVGAAAGGCAGAAWAAPALAAGPLGWMFFAAWVAAGGLMGSAAGVAATKKRD